MRRAHAAIFRRACLGLACCALWAGCREGPAENPQRPLPRTVYALGHLQPATGVIEIRATPGDRLQSLAAGVAENRLVPADGILGVLDSYAIGQAQLLALEQKKRLASQQHQHQQQLAVAQLAQAKASRAQAEAKQHEVLLQEDKLHVMAETMRLEQTEYATLQQLGAEDAELVTPHQLAKQKNKLDMATQEYRAAQESFVMAQLAARATVQAAEASYQVAQLAVAQSRREFDEQLEAQLLEQEIKVAAETLKRSLLLAPKYSQAAVDQLLHRSEPPSATPAATQPASPGGQPRSTVLKIFSRDGEIITQMPIMQLADLSRMVCVAEVYEADRKELSVGQPVIIRSPAFSGTFADGPVAAQSQGRSGGMRGRVARIGRLIASPGLTNRNPLAPADRSVVEVLIEIDPAAQQAAEGDALQARKPAAPGPGQSGDAHAQAAKNVGLQVTVEFIHF